MLITLLACALYPAPQEVPTWPRVGDVLNLEVTARIAEPEEPVAWTALARVGTADPAPTVGCHRVTAGPTADQGVDRIAVDVPAATDLTWQPSQNRWGAEGPRAAVDPAWAVGTVVWERDGERARAPGAIRFAGITPLRGVARDDDGSVWIWWAGGENRVVVRASAGGADFDCLGSRTGVRVPWWLVPAQGGAVMLRTEQDRLTIVPDRGVVRVRTVLEQRVPLDVPLTTQGQPPVFRETPRDRPKRLYRLIPITG